MKERRRYERVTFLCRVKIAPASGGPAVEAWTTDISLGGVGISSPTIFPVGTTMSLSFIFQDPKKGEIVERVIGNVMNATSNIDGKFLGIAFAERITEAMAPRLTAKIESL
jgi:c-di-GMP-binding flagellar brake protein YcgR